MHNPPEILELSSVKNISSKSNEKKNIYIYICLLFSEVQSLSIFNRFLGF